MIRSDGFEQAPRLWVNTVLFLSTFLGAVIVVPWYGVVRGYGTAAWTTFAVLFAATGLSISAGYHRLWAHRTYRAHWTVRLAFMFFGAMALESSILAWSSGHRRHHLYIDDNLRDPYCARRGFWFSHIGWMLRDYPSGKRDDSNIRDVSRDPIAVFQDRYYVPLVLTTNIGVPLLIGWWADDVLGVFLLGGLLRLVVNHHATFFINSLAHAWGSQPYTDANTARDNGFLALLTHGEGYHNFHHLFAGDYRNGVRWWQWDPAKWLICALSWVGLTRDLKRTPAIRIERTRLARQLKRLDDRLVQRLSLHPWPGLTRLRARLAAEHQWFTATCEQWRRARECWCDTRREEFRAHTNEALQRLRLQGRRLRWLSVRIVWAA